MTLEQTKKLLAEMMALWPSFQPSAGIAAAWQRLLADEDPRDVLKALHMLISRAPLAFAPSAPEILHAVRELQQGASKQLESADQAWTSIPDPQTDLAKHTFRQWGGRARWRMLPDIRYHHSPRNAQFTLDQARREFCALFEANKKSREVSKHQISVTDERKHAKMMLSAVNKQTGKEIAIA